MTRSEKFIRVCEVLRSKVYETIVDDFVDPDVYVYESDIKEIGLNFFSFASTLYDLGSAGFVDVEAVYEPINTDTDVEELVYLYSTERLENPSLRFKVFAKGDLGNLISNLDKGIPFEELTPKALNFNSDTSILEVKGNAIRIARQVKKPIEHYILEFLAKENFKEEYSYSELRENEVYDKNAELKTYINSCRTLNKKIEKDTKEEIKDFLIYGTTEDGAVKINPAYLPK